MTLDTLIALSTLDSDITNIGPDTTTLVNPNVFGRIINYTFTSISTWESVV
jgi:hypothetical protein